MIQSGKDSSTDGNLNVVLRGSAIYDNPSLGIGLTQLRKTVVDTRKKVCTLSLESVEVSLCELFVQDGCWYGDEHHHVGKATIECPRGDV